MKNFSIYITACVCAFISCKPMNTTIGMRQVYTSPKSRPIQMNTLPSLKILLEESMQVFLIPSNIDTILYGTYGTTIHFHPHCLQTENSKTYIGTIHVQFKELYTTQALLRERAATVSNEYMLESDGALFIDARSENGASLFVSCEEGIKIRIPRIIKPNMIFFDGFRDSNANMNWIVSDSIVPILEPQSDYFSEEGLQDLSTLEYYFRTKSFGWINCDRFYDDSREKTDLFARFKVPGYEKKIIEIQNYIVFDSLMSVLPMYLAENGQWICNSLPVGEHVTCISIQKSEHKLYWGILKTEVGRSRLEIPLKEIKESELKVLLELSL